MRQLLGEYDCKLDPKGRLRLPTGLLNQLEEKAPGFVINRGFEKCLTLYPKDVWDKITHQINNLNAFVKKHREFQRYFFRGAQELKPDSADRILLPKRLLEFAAIDKELILSAMNDRIEIWSKEAYDLLLEEEPQDFSDLAEEVLGNDLLIGGGHAQPDQGR